METILILQSGISIAPRTFKPEKYLKYGLVALVIYAFTTINLIRGDPMMAFGISLVIYRRVKSLRKRRV